MLLAQIIELAGEPVIYPLTLRNGSWAGLTVIVRSVVDGSTITHTRDAGAVVIDTGPAAGFTVEVDP